MPPNWSGNLSTIPGGLQNESLMVWFRVSAFPWFKKLYGRPAVQSTVLTKGNYSFLLTYSILKSDVAMWGEGFAQDVGVVWWNNRVKPRC